MTLPARSLDYVSMNDGTTCTLMLSENLQAGFGTSGPKAHNWWDFNAMPTGGVNGPNLFTTFGTIFFGTATGNNAGYSSYLAAYANSGGSANGAQMSLNIQSNHGGGAVVAFCDTHCGFLRDDANATIVTSPSTTDQRSLYHCLVTPDGAQMVVSGNPEAAPPEDQIP